MRMLKIYTAAMLSDAQELHSISLRTPYVHFHARWLMHVLYHHTLDVAENAKTFWTEDEEDIKASDFCLIWGSSPVGILRGALVEVGLAIGNHVPVLCVGNHPSFGTWQYHPGVKARLEDMPAALKFLKEMASI